MRAVRPLPQCFGMTVWLMRCLAPLRAPVSPSTGAVQGTVTDPSGAVVPGAAVVLSHPARDLRREAQTAPDDTFHFPLTHVQQRSVLALARGAAVGV